MTATTAAAATAAAAAAMAMMLHRVHSGRLVKPPRRERRCLKSFFIEDILFSDGKEDAKHSNFKEDNDDEEIIVDDLPPPPPLENSTRSIKIPVPLRPQGKMSNCKTAKIPGLCAMATSDTDSSQTAAAVGDAIEVNKDIPSDHPRQTRNQKKQPDGSPLNALIRMTSTTIKGMDLNQRHNNLSDPAIVAFYSRQLAFKRRRKTRTAFTAVQIQELERRFHLQKYLTPADRDDIAASLGLSNAQVITWFQNRRAKLKREVEELKNDITAAAKTSVSSMVSPILDEDSQKDMDTDHNDDDDNNKIEDAEVGKTSK